MDPPSQHAALGPGAALTAPGLGEGTGWVTVYHCCVSRFTSLKKPLKVDCTTFMVKTQTAEPSMVPPFLPRKLAE